MERIADDAAALLDHLGIGQAVACGVRWAATRRSRWCAATPRACAAWCSRTPRRRRTRAEARATRAALAEKVLKEGAVAAAEANLPKLLGATTHRERPAVVARIRDLIVTQRPRAIANALAGLASRADSTPTLREIRVPTLVICGAEDAITPPSDAEAIQKGIAGSRLEIVPAAGHLSNVEAPDAFGRALAGFLASL